MKNMNSKVETVYVGKGCKVTVRFKDGSQLFFDKQTLVDMFNHLKEIGVIVDDCF